MLTPWRSILQSKEKGTVWDCLRPEDLWIEGIQVLPIPWFSSARLLMKRCLSNSSSNPFPQPGLRTPSLEGISLLWPPLPGRAIKLFSTSSQPLSLRFNFASVRRGQVSVSVCAQAFSQHSNQRSTTIIFCLPLFSFSPQYCLPDISSHIYYWLYSPLPHCSPMGQGLWMLCSLSCIQCSKNIWWIKDDSFLPIYHISVVLFHFCSI